MAHGRGLREGVLAQTRPWSSTAANRIIDRPQIRAVERERAFDGIREAPTHPRGVLVGLLVEGFAATANYVRVDELDGVLVATGSEVAISVEAAKTLAAEGTRVRVVSMPCWEDFAASDAAYRESVLPERVRKRLSVEAGVTLGWDRYASAQHGIDTFGQSAPGAELAERLGFSAQAVAAHFRRLG